MYKIKQILNFFFNTTLKVFTYLVYFILKKRIEEAKFFVFFVGYPRSGHSLVGAIIDAHPNCVVSHELNAFYYLFRNLKFVNVCVLIYLKSLTYRLLKLKKGGYQYVVSDRIQFKKKLLVIGDKKGGATTQLIVSGKVTTESLLKTIPIPCKIFFVIRNPFDNIATIANKNFNGDLICAIDHYEQKTIALDHFLSINENENILLVYHEDIIYKTEYELIRIFNFLNVPFSNNLLVRCNKILYKEPRQTSKQMYWNDENILRINQLMQKFYFLEKYIVKK